MLVLSKLTNINHASGGSYDPPLFLYSALFAAQRRTLAGCPARRRSLAWLPRTAAVFGGASPPGGGLWRGFPARRRLWRGFPVRRRGLALLPRPAAGFGGAAPPGGALRGCTVRRRALAGCPARRRALAGLSRPAAGFGAAAPPGGGALAGCPARLFLPAWYIRLGAGSSFRCFSHTRPAYGKSIRKNFAGYIAVFHIA